MSKQEYVEVTVKIPKRLMDMLGAEDYFGWSKEDFFIVAVKRSISCELGELDWDEEKELEAKYGEDLGIVTFDIKRIEKQLVSGIQT